MSTRCRVARLSAARQRVFEAVAIALRNRSKFSEEYRTFHPDGTMRWILARGAATTMKQANCIGCLER
jgi:hypothetical protein